MPNAEHRESGINLFKQRCVQKCHSHGEVCQRALKVWWVRASSRVCCHGIKHWVCPVWFEELLFLNGLVCQHVQIPLRGQNKELSRHYSVGIFLSASNDCVRWEKVWDNWNRENVICWRKYNRNGPVLCPVPNQASLCQNPKVNMVQGFCIPWSCGMFWHTVSQHLQYLHRTGPPTALRFHSSHFSTHYLAYL